MPKLLLVEDNQAIQEMLGRFLRWKGYEVLSATTGLAGVALASAEQPDIILMDISLPELDGWEATRRIRATGATMPIIALTAHALGGDRQACLDAGCSDYMTKPVDLLHLVTKLEEVAARPSSISS